MRRELTEHPSRRRGAHRIPVRAAALIAVAAWALAAYSGAGGSGSGSGAAGDPKNAAEAKAEPAEIALEATAGDAPVTPGGMVTVRAKAGKLTEVRVGEADADAFAGAMPKDRAP